MKFYDSNGVLDKLKTSIFNKTSTNKECSGLIFYDNDGNQFAPFDVEKRMKKLESKILNEEIKMKKIILNGSTDEVHIKDVDVNRPIFVKKDGRLIGIVCKEIHTTHCGIYNGRSNACSSHYNLHDLIQNYSQYGYTFHVED